MAARTAATLLLVAGVSTASCSDDKDAADPDLRIDAEIGADLADTAPPADGPPPDLALVPPDPAIEAYVELVAQAERQLRADPPTVLATLRQLYYGAPWSFSSTSALWQFVIPCSPELQDPRAVLGEDLFAALGARAETGGVDMGHVFAGLEAMVCPAAKVVLVDMSNEDFATWGGDLGAAVAARAACLALGADAATQPDCGNRPGGEPLDFYVDHHAPPQDIEGDLDPFAMRAALTDTPCQSSRMVPLVLDRPLSEVLGDYYLDSTSALGQARRRRDRCLLEMIGGTFTDDRITNRDAVLEQVSAQLSSFAETYYLTIRTSAITPAERSAIQTDARQVAASFLDRLSP